MATPSPDIHHDIMMHQPSAFSCLAAIGMSSSAFMAWSTQVSLYRPTSWCIVDVAGELAVRTICAAAVVAATRGDRDLHRICAAGSYLHLLQVTVRRLSDGLTAEHAELSVASWIHCICWTACSSQSSDGLTTVLPSGSLDCSLSVFTAYDFHCGQTCACSHCYQSCYVISPCKWFLWVQ